MIIMGFKKIEKKCVYVCMYNVNIVCVCGIKLKNDTLGLLEINNLKKYIGRKYIERRLIAKKENI